MSCRPHWISPRWMISALSLCLLVLAVTSLMLGPAALSVRQVCQACCHAVRGQAEYDPVTRIVLTTRLPRILLAMTVGAGLAMSGLAAQTLLRNSLASPYVIGVSNGAAVGAVAAMFLVGKWIPFGAVPVLSAASGLMVTATVFLFAQRGRNFGHSLLLTGIAISAFCSALTAGALYLAGERLQTLVFWLMGGLWQATWSDVLIMLPLMSICLIGMLLLAPAMNVALAGQRSARDLGVNVRRLQSLLLFFLAVTTAVAVSRTGVIGFVGLIVPHLLRLTIGADHRGLVPASALGGALLLLTADTIARTAAAPVEIPVGILTALVGAPTFLWMLQYRAGGRAGV